MKSETEDIVEAAQELRSYAAASETMMSQFFTSGEDLERHLNNLNALAERLDKIASNLQGAEIISIQQKVLEVTKGKPMFSVRE